MTQESDYGALPDPADVPAEVFIHALGALQEEQQSLLEQCATQDRRPIDSIRQLVAAALRRSRALIEGFLLLAGQGNRFAALPLIRLQLDSAMRVHACTLVKDPLRFVKHMLEGNAPRRYREQDPIDLSDVELHRSLALRYPEISEEYQHTSGYVHLSEQHLFGFFDIEKLHAEDVVFTDAGHLPPWSEDEIKGAMVQLVYATHVLIEECNRLFKLYPAGGQ